jgi:hypothetical protein
LPFSKDAGPGLTGMARQFHGFRAGQIDVLYDVANAAPKGHRASRPMETHRHLLPSSLRRAIGELPDRDLQSRH